MLGLEKKVGDSKVNFLEIASIIQCRVSTNGIQNIVDEIIALRIARDDSTRKNILIIQCIKIWQKQYSKEAQTFRDYADVNIRYLKATGLFTVKVEA